MNLATNIGKYLDGGLNSEGRRPDARYTSFDYCFNYFQSFRDAGNTAALANPANIQLSCLQLGFYLASWGMLRGSAELLQKSARHLVPVIEVIARADRSLWELDVNAYSESNIQRLLEAAAVIRRAHSEDHSTMSDILVTKIMLGVFGNVPAFDTNFRRGFKVTSFGPKALRRIAAFYQNHAEIIDAYRVPTLHFFSGKPTKRHYTRAKVIDMAFFIEGSS